MVVVSLLGPVSSVAHIKSLLDAIRLIVPPLVATKVVAAGLTTVIIASVVISHCPLLVFLRRLFGALRLEISCKARLIFRKLHAYLPRVKNTLIVHFSDRGLRVLHVNKNNVAKAANLTQMLITDNFHGPDRSKPTKFILELLFAAAVRYSSHINSRVNSAQAVALRELGRRAPFPQFNVDMLRRLVAAPHGWPGMQILDKAIVGGRPLPQSNLEFASLSLRPTISKHTSFAVGLGWPPKVLRRRRSRSFNKSVVPSVQIITRRREVVSTRRWLLEAAVIVTILLTL